MKLEFYSFFIGQNLERGDSIRGEYDVFGSLEIE